MQKLFISSILLLFLSSTLLADHQSDMQDFEARTQTIQALYSAFENSARSANLNNRVGPVKTKIERDIEQARQHYLQHQPDQGQSILRQSYEMVKNAIIQLRDGSTVTNQRQGDQYEIRATEPKTTRDHDRLNKSIDTLLQAYQRVSTEKGLQAQAHVLKGNIHQIRTHAENRYAGGEQQSAVEMLQGAYTLVKEALAALREGDTLVQSLNFANDEEEYQYYENKVASQLMALNILLSLKQDDNKNKMLNSIVSSSVVQVEQAKSLASNGNHQQANQLMDKAFSRLQSGLMMSLSSN